MASLTETAYYTRKGVNWVILSVIAYFILRLTWGLFVALWLYFFPPQAPPPNHAFGKIPAVKFPNSASGSAQLTFRLEMIEGAVPTASNAATVYFMPKNSATLNSLDTAKEFARKLDFTIEPKQESKYLFLFEDLETPLRMMRYDIISKNFVLRYMFERDSSLFTERNVPLDQDVFIESKTFLQGNSLYPEDIAQSTPAVQYLKYEGNSLIKTTSHSQSDAIRIDYFRAPIGDMPVMTSNPEEGPITFIYSGSSNPKKKILQIAYTYWPIDLMTTGTYELKQSITAWQELQNGGGYIARYPRVNKTTATIRKIYLAYYDSLEAQTYLQPVFVFEGDEGFMAYVPAISPTWTE